MNHEHLAKLHAEAALIAFDLKATDAADKPTIHATLTRKLRAIDRQINESYFIGENDRRNDHQPAAMQTQDLQWPKGMALTFSRVDSTFRLTSADITSVFDAEGDFVEGWRNTSSFYRGGMADLTAGQKRLLEEHAKRQLKWRDTLIEKIRILSSVPGGSQVYRDYDGWLEFETMLTNNATHGEHQQRRELVSWAYMLAADE